MMHSWSMAPKVASVTLFPVTLFPVTLFFVLSCASAGAPPPSQKLDQDGLPVARMTTAPLQDQRTVMASVPCPLVFAHLARPSTLVGKPRFVRWENLTTKNGAAQKDSIRSYTLDDRRITERIAVARSPALWGTSYIHQRSSKEWPFRDHLLILRMTAPPQGQGCQVKMTSFYWLPTGLASFRAEEHLKQVVLPSLVKHLKSLGPELMGPR